MARVYRIAWCSKDFDTIEEAYENLKMYAENNYSEYTSKFNVEKWAYLKKNVIVFYQNNDTIPFQWLKYMLQEIRNLRMPEVRERLREIEQTLYDYGYGDHSISKYEEIKLLEKLCKTDSYFAEAFSKHFNQMKQNILNDFPILHQIDLQNA